MAHVVRWNKKGKAHILWTAEPIPQTLCGAAVPWPWDGITTKHRQEPAPQNVCKRCLRIGSEAWPK